MVWDGTVELDELETGVGLVEVALAVGFEDAAIGVDEFGCGETAGGAGWI